MTKKKQDSVRLTFGLNPYDMRGQPAASKMIRDLRASLNPYDMRGQQISLFLVSSFLSWFESLWYEGGNVVSSASMLFEKILFEVLWYEATTLEILDRKWGERCQIATCRWYEAANWSSTSNWEVSLIRYREQSRWYEGVSDKKSHHKLQNMLPPPFGAILL